VARKRRCASAIPWKIMPAVSTLSDVVPTTCGRYIKQLKCRPDIDIDIGGYLRNLEARAALLNIQFVGGIKLRLRAVALDGSAILFYGWKWAKLNQ
jgi:hypothetical protein